MTARRAAVASGISLAVFAALAFSVPGDGGALGWDADVARAVNAVVPVSSEDVHADTVMLALLVAVAAPAAVLGLALLRRRRFGAALFLAGAVGSAVLLATVAKALVARPPIEGRAADHSFPSGTATLTAAIVVAVVLLARPRRLQLLLAAAGAAFLLVYGGAIVFEEWHYPSDVVAGWALAISSAAAVWLAFGRPQNPAEPSRSSCCRTPRARRSCAWRWRGCKRRQQAAPCAPFGVLSASWPRSSS